MPKIMIVAGEASGDLHGAHLAKFLKESSVRPELFGLGGPQMRQAGVKILADPTQVAVIGLVEVLRHLPEFRKLFDTAVKALDEQQPNLVVLIDYPGFNLRFAEEVKKRKIRLIYYISPQIWAWDPGRIHKIRELVNRMIVVFPFEKTLYEKAGVPVTWVGHPLLDQVKSANTRMETLEKLGLEDGLPVIGLLPGSRAGEISRLLPVLLAAGEKLAQQLPSSARFLLIKAPHLPWELYKEALSRSSLQPKVVERWDYDCIHACDLVAVASGTATLECALLERPMVVVYKTSWPTYLASRLLVRIKAIALVNIVAGRKIVPELIQHQAAPDRIAGELLKLWNSADRREKLKEDFAKLRDCLGNTGASRRAAAAVLAELGLR